MTVMEILKNPHFWAGFREGLRSAILPAVLGFVFCLWVFITGGYTT